MTLNMNMKLLEDQLGSHSSEEEEDQNFHKKRKNKTGHARASKHDGAVHHGPSRTRPTNNQMMYKAHFRWQHDNIPNAAELELLEATDPCPSVASCFLQVLQVLQTAEQHRAGTKRNILQILSINTRRTKVVELSSGTHRIPDELRRNFLSDGAGGQYSTNLDRNRYGSDDNYLFTVIRHDLEVLRLCPCMVDVEIIDSKAGNASTLVQCGLDGCNCRNKVQHIAARAADEAAAAAAAAAGVAMPAAAAAAAGALAMTMAPGAGAQDGQKPAGLEGGPSANSGQRSNNSGSSLFYALAAGQKSIEPQAIGGVFCMPDAAGVARPSILDASPDPTTSQAAVPEAGDDACLLPQPFSKPQAPAPARQGEATRRRPLPQKSRSRLWSALSLGDLDSLQNALDEYVKGGGEDEIFSGPLNLPSMGELEGGGAAPGGDRAVRLGKRKPPQANASFLLMGADSTGCFSGLSKLGLSLFEDDSNDSFREGMDKLDSPLLPLGIGEEGGETGNALNTSNELTDTMHKQRSYHRPVPRQATVSSMSSRAAADKLAAEVEALRAENLRLRTASAAQGSAPSATHLFDLEQNLIEHKAKIATLQPKALATEQREQAAQQRAAEAEARNASLVRELAQSRAEVATLLSRLSGSAGSMGSASTSFLTEYQHSKPSGLFDFSTNGSNRFPSNWQQQQQQQQLQHAALTFCSYTQPQAAGSSQGPVLNALFASQLGAGMHPQGYPHPHPHPQPQPQGYSTLL